MWTVKETKDTEKDPVPKACPSFPIVDIACDGHQRQTALSHPFLFLLLPVPLFNGVASHLSFDAPISLHAILSPSRPPVGSSYS